MKTYIKTQAETVEIEKVEYELKAMADGRFLLSVWAWSEGNGEIVRHHTYILTSASLQRFVKLVGTYQANGGWIFGNGQAIMEIAYIRELS